MKNECWSTWRESSMKHNNIILDPTFDGGVKMNLFNHRYYKVNKLFLSIIGQWPYQKSHRRNFIVVLGVVLTITQIVPLILAIIKNRHDRETLSLCAISMLLSIAIVAKFSCSILHSQNMLRMLDRIRFDWKVWAGHREVNILHEYAERGRAMTIGYAVVVYIATLGFMVQPIISKILDITLGNGSQPEKFPLPVDYHHLDVQKYYFYILMLNCPCQIGAVTIAIALDSMFIVYVQHCCGQFAALGHKLKRFGENEESMQAGKPRRIKVKRNMSFEFLTSCIHRHEAAIEYAVLLETTYTSCLFVIAGLNVLGISLLGIQILTEVNNRINLGRFVVFFMIDVIHLFMENYMSQMLMDHSISIRDNIYDGSWYKLSPKTRQILHFMIMRSNIPCKLTAGKIATMSVETFASLMKTSMSYFTLLRSV